MLYSDFLFPRRSRLSAPRDLGDDAWENDAPTGHALVGMCVYIHRCLHQHIIYMYVYLDTLYVCIYIYIYREKEREHNTYTYHTFTPNERSAEQYRSSTARNPRLERTNLR